MITSILTILNLPICGILPEQTLTAYSESIPKTVAKLDMLPVPAPKTGAFQAFYMSKTETTWELFDAFLAGGPPSKPYDQTKFAADAIARPSKSYILPDLGWGHKGFPVINVSSDSAEMFCRWLSKVTKKKYRLPTEAEWDWACRAGSEGPWKMDKATLEKNAWFAGNSKSMTKAVGKKLPNAWGFHDMIGNTGEWAVDKEGKFVLCGSTFRDKEAVSNPSRRQSYDPSWQETDPQIPKSRWWLSDGPFVGFRVVCES